MKNTRRLPYFRNMVEKTHTLPCICCSHVLQMQGSLHVFFFTMFPKQGSVLVFFISAVPILFIGSTRHINNFYRKFFTPCFCCFCGGSSTELFNLYLSNKINLRLNKEIFGFMWNACMCCHLLYYWAEFSNNHPRFICTPILQSHQVNIQN